MFHTVSSVKPLQNFLLELMFDTKEKRIFDVKLYLHIGKFQELKNQNLFSSVHISFDTIEWANSVDLDPEFLYRTSIPA